MWNLGKTFGKLKEYWRFPVDSDEAKVRLIYNNVLAHPSVIIRKSSLIKNKLLYNPQFRKFQDYDLWSRAASCLHFSNMDEFLVNYRVHEEFSIEKQNISSYLLWKKIISYQLRELGIKATKRELLLHALLSNENKKGFNDKEVIEWLIKLYKANRLKRKFNNCVLLKVIVKKYLIFTSNKFSNRLNKLI